MDVIVVRRILDTCTVLKSRQAVNNILRQPHRQQGRSPHGGLDGGREACGDCGAAWKALGVQRQNPHDQQGARGQGQGHPDREV